MAKVSGQRKIYEMINERIIELLGKGHIPVNRDALYILRFREGSSLPSTLLLQLPFCT